MPFKFFSANHLCGFRFNFCFKCSLCVVFYAGKAPQQRQYSGKNRSEADVLTYACCSCNLYLLILDNGAVYRGFRKEERNSGFGSGLGRIMVRVWIQGYG